MKNYLFASEVSGCSTIIRDITDYSTDSDVPESRSECAIALFWSNDAFTSCGGILTNPSNGVFNVDMDNNEIYLFRMYWVPLWATIDNVPIVVPKKGIIFYNNYFYQNATSGDLTHGVDPDPIYGNSVEWTMLSPVIADHDKFYDAVVTKGLDYGEYEQYIQSQCVSYAITMPSCGTYNICDQTLLSGNKKYNLYRYGESEPIETGEIPEGQCLTITLPDSDVYLLEIERHELIDSYVLYEYCSLKTCYLQLVSDILCSRIDPCCTSCSPEEIERLRIKRDYLNMMNALIFTLIATLNYDSFGYYLLTPDDFQASNTTAMIRKYILRIKELISQCGECNGASNNTNNQNCRECQ